LASKLISKYIQVAYP